MRDARSHSVISLRWPELRPRHHRGRVNTIESRMEGGAAMTVSDGFDKLKEQVDEADRSIRAAANQGEAELKSMVEEARKNADRHADELRAKSDEVADQAEHHWHEVQGDWDAHIKRMHARIDAKKAAFDADIAETDAELAEADAA